jgi:hypothetical protein
MSVINRRYKPVKTHTQRWHHRDTDSFERQYPDIYRELVRWITSSVERSIAGDSRTVLNSSVEGKALLTAFPGTAAMQQFCDAVNGQRQDPSRHIEPRHIYGVALLRVLGQHADTWRTTTTRRKGMGYGIRTYERIVALLPQRSPHGGSSSRPWRSA